MAGPAHKPVSPLGGVKAFSCPSCAGQVELRAPGQTLAASCRHCGSVIDLADENLKILQQARKKMDKKLVIPIGKRGELFGTEWEVIGFMVRKVVDYQYYWEEYLLFNPWQGFRWLINNYGHWTFGTPLMEYPDYKAANRTARFEGNKYNMFSRGGAQVRYVLGEFYWKVKNGDTVQTADLVSPPHMLSYEIDDHGSSWSHGLYLEPKVVQKAFDVEQMPPRRRIGANQPNRAKENWKVVRRVWIWLLLALVGMQIYFVTSAANQVVLKESIEFDEINKKSYVSSPFNLEGDLTNVEVDFRAPSLGNSWVYLDGYLHDRINNKNYGFTKEWEYYYGREGGETWSEGSRKAYRILNNVPAGEYELVLEAQTGKPKETVDIVVRRDVSIFSNFWAILIAISIMPLWYWFKSYSFEKIRWEEADI
ncbi:MAG: DUF4178 domain-containing protein [Bacteroidota bacterium]